MSTTTVSRYANILILLVAIGGRQTWWDAFAFNMPSRAMVWNVQFRWLPFSDLGRPVVSPSSVLPQWSLEFPVCASTFLPYKVACGTSPGTWYGRNVPNHLVDFLHNIKWHAMTARRPCQTLFGFWCSSTKKDPIHRSHSFVFVRCQDRYHGESKAVSTWFTV